MPTSFQDSAETVALPVPPKLPPAISPLVSAEFVPPAGATKLTVGVAPSGTGSRPKAGVATPPEVTADTVAVKASPALTNWLPAASAAAGFVSCGLAVRLMLLALTVKPPGLTINALELAASALKRPPPAALLAHKVTCPVSP